MAINKLFRLGLMVVLGLSSNTFNVLAQNGDVPLIQVPDLEAPSVTNIPQIIEVPLIETQTDQNINDLPADLLGTLNILDKVTARTSVLNLPINQEVRLKNLVLTMRSCKTAPPEEEPETTMFLEISEDKDGLVENIFMGWMFASSPGIHALEHPIYDVWPLSCKTSDGLIYSGK
jgi:hypothetical protein